MVRAERDLSVDLRLISLRLINEHIDYDAHLPPEYEAGNTAGLRLLRAVARARQEHGAEAVGSLQAALGAHIFDAPPADATDEKANRERRGTWEFLEPILREVHLPTARADALEDTSWDHAIRADGEEAPAFTARTSARRSSTSSRRTGWHSSASVISRLPEPEQAGELWDHVVGLARFPASPSSSAALLGPVDLRCGPLSTASRRDGHAGATLLAEW